MFSTSKSKWIGSSLLAALLVVLALLGGSWGTTYAADEINSAPHIDFISPNTVAAGSPSQFIVIGGTGFGNFQNTAVRIVGNGVDEIIVPTTITSTRIWFTIQFTMLANPAAYEISVVMSTVNTLPTVPVTPWDEESNPLPFTVYEIQPGYLPIIFK